MKIRIKRNQYESAAGYTHGRLLTEEGGFLCWTLEDEDRGLRQEMPLTQIHRIKIKGKTAIPAGTYKIQLRVSPSFKNKWYARPFGGKMPYLLNVPGFEGVMLHPGNIPDDTSGCILPGMLQNGIRGRIFDSVLAWQDLMNFYIWPAYQRKEEIWLTIE